MAGLLVLVVGPSGAGKDALIAAAKAELAGDPRFIFPRRVVTRTAHVELEDHDSLEPEDFVRQKQRGAYALDWDAHGLSYGVPASVDAALVAGRTVVTNVSRRVIEKAVEKYPEVTVMMIIAAPEIRAARLARRGREEEADVAQRLNRPAPDLPPNARVVEIDNSGSLEAGIAAFVSALREAAGEL